MGGEGIVVAGHETTGIHNDKRVVVPVRVPVMTIAGHAGQVIDNGIAPACYAVKQGGLAHVGASDDGNDGFHEYSMATFS